MDDPTSTTHVLSTSPPAVTLTIPHMFQHPPQQPAGSSSGPLATSPPGSNLFINHHYHPQQPAGSLTNHNHEPPPLPPINADSTNTSANTSANTSPSLTSQSLSPNFGSSPNFSLNFILSPPDNHIHNLIPPSNNSTPITNNIQIISPTSSHPTIPDSSGYLSCHTSVCLDDKIIVFGGLYKVHSPLIFRHYFTIIPSPFLPITYNTALRYTSISYLLHLVEREKRRHPSV